MSWQVPGNDSDLSVGEMRIERLMDAISDSTSQVPTGTGVVNAIGINFGDAITHSNYTLDANGKLTILTTGMYRLKLAIQFGRDTNAQIARLLFRVVVDGVQAGRSVSVFLNNESDRQYIENDNWVNITAGTEIEYQVMRDSGGVNSGGLFATSPTDSAWNNAPSASLRLERFI